MGVQTHPSGGKSCSRDKVCAYAPARTQSGLHKNTGGSMQDGIEVVASRLTVDGAELVAGVLLSEIDLEVDPTSRDSASNNAGTRIELTRASDGLLLASC